MFFKIKRHFLSNQRVRLKMLKLPKRWLAVGITLLGLCLGIGISVTQVQATPQLVQTVNSKATSPQQSSKAAIASTSLLNNKVSVKAKSPNSRFGSPFVPRLGLKDHLHNRHRIGNSCPCEENGDECTCEDPDDSCGCIDIDDSDCGCGPECACDGDCNDNNGDENDGINDDYGTYKIKLSKRKDNFYWGQDYTVEGSITNNKTGNFNGPLHYYYEFDGQGGKVEFQGPQSVGSNPKTFKFTIPYDKMVPDIKHEIYIIVEDERENTSNAQYLTLIPYAEIKTIERTYYIGDPFDQFGNLAGGLSVTNQPLTKEDISKTVIRDANGKRIRNWNEITAKSGKYTITYIYKYGPDNGCGGCPVFPSGGSVCKKAEIHVIDRKKITLKYVDENLNPIDGKYLTNLAEGIVPGDYEGPYGSKFPLVKTPELSFNEKKYYEFVRFEYADRPAPDLTEDYVTFGDHDQVINVVYKDLRAKAPIKVELINIKDSKDSIIEKGKPQPTNTVIDSVTKHLVYTIDPKNPELFPSQPSVDDKIYLINYISVFDPSNPPAITDSKLTLPKGYTIASKPELEKLGLKQEDPKFGLEEVKTKFYVVKEKAQKQLTISHRCVNKNDFNRLPNIKQMVGVGETITINTKSSVHRPPLGYKVIGANWDGSNRVNRSLQYNTQTGMISGIIPDTPTDPMLTILYRKF